MWKGMQGVVLLLCGSLLLAGCTAEPAPAAVPETEEPIVIALSQIEKDNPWRTAQINSFKDALVPGKMEFVYHEPSSYTTEWQVEDAFSLLEQGVDYLVIVPHDPIAFAPVMERAKETGARIILIEQEAEGISPDDYMTLISTDYVKEGELCAQMLVEKFADEECNIVEISASDMSVIAQARAHGFWSELRKHPNMHIIYSESSSFDRLTAQRAMESVIAQAAAAGRRIDAVFAHSDEDGLGVLQALKIAGMKPGKDVHIVSINGVQDVCKAIVAGEYLGTVESNPRWGQISVVVIQQMERGSQPFRRVFSPYQIINAENAEEVFPIAY